jgi:hypothetical protein
VTLKFGDWVTILLCGCLVFFYFRGIDLGARQNSLGEDVFGNKWLLFILDFQDFSCMTCLDSFLMLYRHLPFRFKTSRSWGILVVKKSEKEERKQLWIAEKQLRGFVRANDITFPVLVDRGRLFGGVAEKGSCVLLLDGTGSLIHRYEFPLTGEEFTEIFKILNN